MGCIPTKALVRSAEAIHTARRGGEFGFRANVEVDFERIIERKNRIVAASVSGIERSLERNPRVDLIRGRARFGGPRTLAVDDREIESERVIVASGVRPDTPSIPGLDEVGYLTNETVMDLETLPRRLVVLGGGAEGLEFGQLFHRFGSRVTIIQRNRRLAPQHDPEISEAIEQILRDEGIEILTGTAPTAIRSGNGTVVVETTAGTAVEGDELLLATGRRPHDLDALGIAEAGIAGDPERGIEIDDQLQTSAPGVWAIGDVMGRVQHTHFATYTAGIAVANALHGAGRRFGLGRVPGAIFTDPEIASVGLTAEQARQQGRSVNVGTQPMSKVGRARVMGETGGFVTFVADADTDELLGMHVLAYHGADLVAQGVIAMAGTGTLEPLTDGICIHPTLSEGVKTAAGNLRPLEIPDTAGNLPSGND